MAEKQLESLNLAQMGVHKGIIAGDIELCAKLYVALELHNQRVAENGQKGNTIRNILDEKISSVDGILKQYVCSFGNYGHQVIARYIGQCSQATIEQFPDRVQKWRVEFGVSRKYWVAMEEAVAPK